MAINSENTSNAPLIKETVDIGIEAKVILFNDDYHSFDEVIAQIIKAIHCNFEHASSLAFQAHVYGKAIVFSGDLAKCIEISRILEEINLGTLVEY